MKKTNQLIEEILLNLEKEKINYCVLRNFGFLIKDEIDPGKDNDIIILEKDVRKIDKIMKNKGFAVWQINPASKHKGYLKYVPEDEKLLRFHFHINGVTGRHTKYLEAGPILKRKRKIGFFYATSPENEFLVVLLHSILDRMRFAQQYRADLQRLIKAGIDFNYVNEVLSNLFGDKGKKIIDLVNKNRFEPAEKLIPELKRKFEFKRILKISYIYLYGMFWKIPRLIKNAPLISLTGMDGAGKTTAVNALKKIFEKNRVKYSIVYTGRGRENILPIQFFGQKYKKSEKKERRLKEFSLKKRIVYTLAAPVFAFDLFLRYLTRILPKRKTKEVVVTDRYSSDILLMANVPMFIKKILYFFLPKPTLTIYLYNRPEVLHKRKPDHPLDDLKRQEKLFEEINKKIRPVKIKSENVKETVEKVSKIIFEKAFV